jgi:stromal membrane-associated protein
MYTVGPVAPISGVTSMRASGAPIASPVPSITPAQSGKDYDFSSMQGMFTKR